MRVLLASYDSVIAGPGRSQTLPYVRGLAARGHRHALLSFERADADPAQIAEVDEELAGAPWTRVPWRRRALFDLAAGLKSMRRAARSFDADLVHARGYVPAFLARRLGLPYLFDMRGFWPDERVDGGLWTRESLGYRMWKRIERGLCRDAAGVVVLTERARDEVRRTGLVPQEIAIHVIPTCTDLDRFRPVERALRPVECAGTAPRWVVLGGTATWYLREETLDLAARALARDPRAVLHVLTNDPLAPIESGLARRGVPEARRVVQAVPPRDVPAWVSGAEAAIVLIKPAPSKRASCPTKLGELLGCGVPLVMSEGIGDCDRLLREERVGVALARYDAAGYDAALDALVALSADGAAELRARCRAVAEREFALSHGIDRYDDAYVQAARRAGVAA